MTKKPTPPTPPSDDTTPPTDQLALEAKVAELTDSFLRARADLDNFRRRTERERDDAAIAAGARALLVLLPLVDELDRAVDHLPPDLEGHDWVKGVVQVRANMETTLQRLGAERFGAPGDTYDAELHEALARGAGPADQVTAVFEAGYRYQGRVLRPAKVQVGSDQAASD